jgi:hypothetical protein
MGADSSWFCNPGSQLEQGYIGRGEGEVGEPPEETGFTETK